MTEKHKATRKDRRTGWIAISLTLIFLALGLWYYWSARRARQPHSLDSFVMGSYVEQTVWGTEGSHTAAEVAGLLADLENSISWRVEGSPIAWLNEKAGESLAGLDEASLAVLEEALELCEKSGGALDITLGPVTRLWNFDGAPRLPDAGELESVLRLVDYRKLLTGEGAFEEFLPVTKELFDGRASEACAVLTEPDMAVDLGAVGKGAACDTAVAEYRRSQAQAAVIAVGGSVGLYGKKPDSKPFRVSVRSPLGEGSLGVLELDSGFVSTSGSYEKFFEEDGAVYHHLLDPRTGYPAESGLVSVTVWHPESGLASDGLATACFILGLEKGRELLEESGGGGIFIDRENNVYLSGGLAERFSLDSAGFRLADWP